MRSLPALILLALGILACDGAAPLSPDSGLRDLAARSDRATDGPRPLERSAPREASAGPDAPVCPPRPFVPTGPTTSWNNLASAAVVLSGAANHRAQDAVVLAGGPQLLIGKFAYGALDVDLDGEDVELFVQQSPPCGDWISLGTTATSEAGQYGSQYGIEDDGGRVFFTIPAPLARGPGRHPVRMLVRGDHSQAAMILHVVAPGTGTVVFDIDGTLTTDDFQLVAQLFSQILAGTYQPKMQPGALDVVQAWSHKGYLPLYLTGRPEQLRASTLAWLVSGGFPPGALRLTYTLAEALPTPGGVGTFKSQQLQALGSKAQLDLFAAYGNATTDIQAYAAGGIAKGRTFIIGGNGGAQGTVAVDGYQKHLPAAQASPAATVPAPPSVGWVE